MPKFTIVVPVFKVEQYIDRCIESLINQTLKDIEIILVDDGSPDNCGSICDSYAERDKRITVIHKANAGVSAARNDGLKAATGEWVIFCDSDDWMELDACEILYETGINGNADIVIGDIYIVNENSKVYTKYYKENFVITDRTVLDQLVMTDIYMTYCPFPGNSTIGFGGPWNKAVRLDFLKKHQISFDTTVKGVFDDILYTAHILANATSVSYISTPVYNYVLLSSSITHIYKANILEINQLIFNSWERFFAAYGGKEKYLRPYSAVIIRRFCESLNQYFFNEKNPDDKKTRLRKIKEVIKSEPYKSAIKNVDRNKLIKFHAVIAYAMSLGSPFLIVLAYELRQHKKRKS